MALCCVYNHRAECTQAQCCCNTYDAFFFFIAALYGYNLGVSNINQPENAQTWQEVSLTTNTISAFVIKGTLMFIFRLCIDKKTIKNTKKLV